MPNIILRSLFSWWLFYSSGTVLS